MHMIGTDVGRGSTVQEHRRPLRVTQHRHQIAKAIVHKHARDVIMFFIRQQLYDRVIHYLVWL